MLNVLDSEDVMIVRACISGKEARDMCLLFSNVMCSYTCEYRHKKGGEITLHI